MTLDDVDVAGVLCPARVALSQGFACAGDGGRAFDRGRKSGVGESVNGLKADISVLAGLDVSKASDEELLAGAEALAGLASRLGAVRGRWLVAIGERGSWRASGERTLVRWNEKASGQSPAAAARICRFMFPWRLLCAWKTLSAAVLPSAQTILWRVRSQCSKAASQQPEASTRAASAPSKQVGPMTV